MKLKLLVAPFTSLLIVYLIIWHVIPAYFGPTGVKATSVSLEKINEKNANIEDRKANAAKLATALNYNADQQTILRQYLPDEKRDEEVINSLSSIASSKNVSITIIKMVDVPNAPTAEFATVATVNDGSATMEPDASVVSNESLLQKFNVEIGVVGSYANIRELIVALTRLKRFNDIESLNVDASVDGGDSFIATIIVSFNYLSKLTSIANVDEKIFASDKFDMSVVDDIKNKTSAEVSPVAVGDASRMNPFAL